jgi:flagellar biogenesis protein FliO
MRTRIVLLSFLFTTQVILTFNVRDSLGAVGLKQIQVNSPGEIQLHFDGKISGTQVSTEYVNDIVQLSLRDTTIYPAKILPVKGEVLKKVFAYQYSPKVVRCRFSVDGKAEALKNKVRVDYLGKSIRVQFLDQSMAAQEEGDFKPDTIVASRAGVQPMEEVTESDEKAILEKVRAVGGDIESSEAQDDVKKPTEKKGSHQLTGGKPLPSIWSAFGKMGIVLVLLGAVLALVKKFKSGSNEQMNLVNAIKSFAQGKLQKPDPLIEVVSSHYLDQKKRIAVVKVAGRLLVLGVSSDSINLITQLSESQDSIPESESEFEDLISSKTNEGSKTPVPSSVRSRIRSRLEGLKPL